MIIKKKLMNINIKNISFVFFKIYYILKFLTQIFNVFSIIT